MITQVLTKITSEGGTEWNDTDDNSVSILLDDQRWATVALRWMTFSRTMNQREFVRLNFVARKIGFENQENRKLILRWFSSALNFFYLDKSRHLTSPIWRIKFPYQCFHKTVCSSPGSSPWDQHTSSSTTPRWFVDSRCPYRRPLRSCPRTFHSNAKLSARKLAWRSWWFWHLISSWWGQCRGCRDGRVRPQLFFAHSNRDKLLRSEARSPRH